MEKKYKYGLYIGRFQPIHIGHESIIRKMLDECEQIIIAIGSAQENGTERNPFTFEQRADLILNIFYQYALAGRLSIIAINDRENPSNDASWGDYLFRNVYNMTGVIPDAIYEGEEEERNTWYDNWRVNIEKVSRTDIPVSATRLREAIKNEEYTEAVEMLPAAITYRISDMRRIIQDAKQN